MRIRINKNKSILFKMLCHKYSVVFPAHPNYQENYIEVVFEIEKENEKKFLADLKKNKILYQERKQ